MFILPILVLAISFFGIVSQTLAAETSSGVAISIPIADKKAKDGSILSSTPKGYMMSTIPYDSSTYGVLVDNPALFVEHAQSSDPKLKPVMTSGKAYVLVATLNGTIKANDFITTSRIPGIGQKASINGFIVGTALESYTNKDPKKIGKILVSIDPRYNGSFLSIRTDILQAIKEAKGAPLVSPFSSIRLILAIIVVIISFVLGFIYFGRVTRTGIEAMGRNPLAGRMIELSLVFHLSLTVVIIASGLGIAYLILVL